VTLGPRERLVIDASVAIKWVLSEPDGDHAEVLLDHGLAASDLLFAECANILRKDVRRGELIKEEADIAAQTLEQGDLSVVSTRGASLLQHRSRSNWIIPPMTRRTLPWPKHANSVS